MYFYSAQLGSQLTHRNRIFPCHCSRIMIDSYSYCPAETFVSRDRNFSCSFWVIKEYIQLSKTYYNSLCNISHIKWLKIECILGALVKRKKWFVGFVVTLAFITTLFRSPRKIILSIFRNCSTGSFTYKPTSCHFIGKFAILSEAKTQLHTLTEYTKRL